MEKQGYREMLEHLKEMFPGRIAITPKEVASVTGIPLNSVYNSMRRAKNPLPSKKLGEKNRLVIPITQLARWLV